MDMRSPLAKVRGLGPSKSGGVAHWWSQRMTSMALAPLMLWFIVSAITLIGASHAEYVAWLSEPGTTLLMTLTVIVLFYHMEQGLQVVIEDYVHGEGLQKLSIVVAKAFSFIAGIASLIAIFRVAFGS